MEKENNRTRLEDWKVRKLGPRLRVLQGTVYGHPVLRDGAYVVTSEVRRLSPKYGWAQTMNTKYYLGKKAE